MKSMDSVRYVPGNSDGEDFPLIRGRKLFWRCPNCKRKVYSSTDVLERSIESEERDPDVEYIICSHCGHAAPLTGRVEAALLREDLPEVDKKGYMYSDGYFVLFTTEEGSVRLL